LFYHLAIFPGEMRPATTRERAIIEAGRRKARIDALRTAEGLRWRDVDSSKEVFIMDELPPEEAWATLNIRKGDVSMHTIYRKFFTDSIIDRLGNDIDPNSFSRSRKTKLKNGKFSRTMQHCNVTKCDILQATSVYIYLIGKQQSAVAVRANGRYLRNRIDEAKEFLRRETGIQLCNTDKIEKIIAKVLLTKEYSDEISLNFQSIVRKLGQTIAGDEKLYFFSGNSGNVRLCISKPGRIGLWFYELCCKLRVGDQQLSFLLDVKMHDSLAERVSVTSIVKRWHTCMKSIGKELVLEGSHPNPKTYLAMDSYYECDEARQYLLSEGQNFTASCSADRVKVEKIRVHKDHPSNVPGDTRTIYNEESKELFTYHWDTQKGVGEKYNLSFGFIHSDAKATVARFKDIIHGYGYYKQSFEQCDNFNRSLHDHCWPHKRGGKGVAGDLGCHNDFLQAVMIQNACNAWYVLNDTSPTSPTMTFEMLMTTLACDLCNESFIDVANFITYC
jgi:hypothetical protein